MKLNLGCGTNKITGAVNIDINPDVSSIAQLDIFAVDTNDHIELFKKGYEAAKETYENHCESLIVDRPSLQCQLV